MRWEIYPTLVLIQSGDAKRPWEEQGIAGQEEYKKKTSLTLFGLLCRSVGRSVRVSTTRVCECLIMTEKRRGNASLPLMSVVNFFPPPTPKAAKENRFRQRREDLLLAVAPN